VQISISENAKGNAIYSEFGRVNYRQHLKKNKQKLPQKILDFDLIRIRSKQS